MRSHFFLLTYSVSPFNTDDTNEADRARSVMRNMNIPNWTKLDDVETTIDGQLTLNSSDGNLTKRSKAENVIKNNIEKELIRKEIDINKIKIDFSVMVDGLGQQFEFFI